MKHICVFVAVHKQAKKYGGETYKFIHVGASKSKLQIEGAVRDDEAPDNISDKNGIYCELTGVYHIWKNIKGFEYVGLCHYRRYPANDSMGLVPDRNILSEKDILNRLGNVDIILLNKSIKNGEINGYFKEGIGLDKYRPYVKMLPVIERLYPDYVNDFKKEFLTPTMSFGNIMICKKDVFDDYCQWLFDILFAVENNMNLQGGPEPRELGYYSEWLLNIWVRHNKLKVDYVDCFFTENRYTIGYLKGYCVTKLKKLLHRCFAC